MKFVWKSSEKDDCFARWWEFVQHSTQGRIGKCQAIDCANAGNSSQRFTLNGKVGREKYELRNFPWRKILFWHFLWRKLFRFTFIRKFFYAAQLTSNSWFDDVNARVSQSQFRWASTLFFVFSCHSQWHTDIWYFSFFSRQKFLHKKILFFQYDKNTCEHFSWNGAEKKTSWRRLFQPRPFCLLITDTYLRLWERDENYFVITKTNSLIFPSFWSNQRSEEKMIEENNKNFLNTTNFFLSCDSLNTRELLNWRIERTDGLAAKTFFPQSCVEQRIHTGWVSDYAIRFGCVPAVFEVESKSWRIFTERYYWTKLRRIGFTGMLDS